MISTAANSWTAKLSDEFYEHSKEFCEWLFQLKEETVVLPGEKNTISLSTRGEGIPLVLIHGFASDRSCWSLILPFLKATHRLILIDLPAWGKSSYQPHVRYRPSDQAARLEALRKALDIEAWHLVGISMGAAIAGIYAAQHPERMKSLTLLNAAGLSAEEGRPFVDDTLLTNNPLVLSKSADIYRLWDRVFFRQPLLTRLFAPALTREYLRRFDTQKKLFEDLIEDPKCLEYWISLVKAPTLVIWGREDKLIDVTCMERLSKIRPDFQYQILEKCGHLPILERPLATARLLNKWLKNYA